MVNSLQKSKTSPDELLEWVDLVYDLIVGMNGHRANLGF
jgi:hypothetical protein